MNKLLTVAWREYWFNLKRPAFLFAAFGTPLFILVVMVVSVIVSSSENDLGEYGPVGLVDLSGVVDPSITLEEFPALFTPFDSEDTARAALDSGQIESYALVPENYLATGRVNLYSNEDAPDALSGALEQLLILNLRSGVETTLPMERFQEPTDLTVETLDNGRVTTEDTFIVMFFLPILFTIIFVMAATTTSSFLMAGLVEERTSRIIEILVTSITPLQFLAGKLIGLGLLGLTQVLILVIATIIGLVVGERSELLQGLTIPFDLFFIGIAYFVLAYFLIASIFAAIGAISNTEQESRQISSVVSILFMFPYFLLISFIEDPNGTLPVALSLIPFTAPIAMLMRIGLTAVPVWQLALSMGIMVVTIIIVVWAAAKVFRWGLLLYGKPFSPREILRVIFSRSTQMGTTQAKHEGAAS